MKEKLMRKAADSQSRDGMRALRIVLEDLFNTAGMTDARAIKLVHDTITAVTKGRLNFEATRVTAISEIEDVETLKQNVDEILDSLETIFNAPKTQTRH